MRRLFMGVAAVALVLGALTLTTPASAANKGTITIGTHNWPENIAVANMWKVILERHGYAVKLVSTLKAAAYSGVANGDLDVGLEVWMPRTDRPYYERFKKRIKLHDAWYRGTRVGLVVPAYVPITSISQLNAEKQAFTSNGTPTIVGIESGSSLMGDTRKAIRDYGLKFNLLTSSSPAMTAALGDAIKKHQPIVVTLWSPHWAFAQWKLKYLDDPKDTYGKGGYIDWMSHVGFASKHPQLTRWLDRWEMTDEQLGGLMNMARVMGNPSKAATKWISQNRELVDSWIRPD